MNLYRLIFFALLIAFSASSCQNGNAKKEKNPEVSAQQQKSKRIVELSEQLIAQLLAGKSIEKLEGELQSLKLEDLIEQLDSDVKKKVFWINIYNTYIQLILKEESERYEDKDAFFDEKLITIAEHEFSFNDIEHGIIRATKFKYGLGYVENPFTSQEIKQLQCDTVDERIHFALNCGAVSCPPVKAYTLANFDYEMEQSTRNFLKAETTFLSIENKVITSRLFKWYQGDFDLSVVEYLKKYEVIPDWAEPTVEYKAYDWEKSLHTP